MVRLVSNPPNPWASAHVEWLEEPPAAQLEVHEEHARSILAENDSPDVGFRWSLNPYRGCFHACAYCLSGDTPILMADGRQRALRDIRVGDHVYGTLDCGGGVRDLVRTRVFAHWTTEKPGVRVVLASGTVLVASADHRFLTEDGWAHVGMLEAGRARLVAPDGAHDGMRVVSVEPCGVTLPMFDITTGTGDFIADGVISHNCYARPSHQWLGFGAGTDFERKIVVKLNAPELLRAQFMKPSWKGELIAFSGDTDCYQPLEASYELTRRCLEVCAEFKNPVGLITKSAVIRRDVELLARLAREARLHVTLSIPFANDDIARKIEPGASSPARRFDTLRILSEAGIPTGVAIAPIIPGLNDPDIPEILERAHAAGARSAFMILVRLPGEVLPVFRERINQELAPERVRKIEHAIEELRAPVSLMPGRPSPGGRPGSGRMNDSRFGARFRGQGERWRAIEALFELHRRRLGFDVERTEGRGDGSPTTFVRPTRQLGLFQISGGRGS